MKMASLSYAGKTKGDVPQGVLKSDNTSVSGNDNNEEWDNKSNGSLSL